MPCKPCLNGAVTHKAPQTPTCSNYCNLHLRLAQTSHASKRQTAARPQGGRQFALVSRNSTFLRLLTGIVIPRVQFRRAVVCVHARAPRFPLQAFGPALKRWWSSQKKKKRKRAVCLTVESTWLNVLACALFLFFLFFFPIAQINRCYLHYKQAHTLLGEANI